MHGVGLCDEYPSIFYAETWEAVGYDGEIGLGMTLCVESYMGEVGGDEGIKLEQKIEIAATGVQRLLSFPYEEGLMPLRWSRS